MYDRKSSAKSIHNDFPIFQYNTSIIDLKIFPTKDEETTTNNYLYDYSTNVPNSNNTFINPKKYLINKNFRFYQPVKDAEMMVQLDSLRLKLQASSNINDRRPIYTHSELGILSRNHNSSELFFNQKYVDNESIKCKNCVHCKEEANKVNVYQQSKEEQQKLELKQLQYMKLIQNEILRGKGSENDTYSLKSYNLSSCTKHSPDIDFYPNHTPENEPDKERHLIKPTFSQSNQNSAPDNDNVDFPELKKYSNQAILKKRIKSSVSINSTNNRLKSAATEAKVTQSVTKLNNKLPVSDQLSPLRNLCMNKNVQKSLRKSTHTRLKNIYKSNDNNMEIIELRSKTPKLDDMPTVSYLDIHAPTLISLLDIKDTNSETNKSISSKIFLKSPKNTSINTISNGRKYQNTIVINDLIDFGANNTRHMSKRALPCKN